MIARFVALLLICGSVCAHDFWIQPDIYRVEPGISVPITLQVGHGPWRQRSMLPMYRITRFVATAPDGTLRDLRANLNLGASTEDGALQFSAPGTYVVVLETDNHARTLEGAESYSRHSKALVQVGSLQSVQATRPSGMQLEIVPDVNPYSAEISLPVHILFEGKPAAGALVELTDLAHDAAPLEAHISDEQGHSGFAMPGAGKWLLNVIWKRRLAAGQDTEFETYFSSLSFGR
jgi:uncharacterized GH25 family protein